MRKKSLFNIYVKKMFWINGSLDDPDDLCLHGDVSVTIGDECFETECVLSSSALYHLKTLTEDHVIYTGNQMLPCSGHSLFPNDSNDTVNISGCPNGIDWDVRHVADGVELTTESKKKTFVTHSEYQKQVFAFADSVKGFYDKCKEKNIPADEFDRRGYMTFWKEWNRRRNY